MPSVKRNIVVNYLGQAWVAVMGLAFLPLYIKYLGMEAYGLIGLFAVMQAWLTLLDMGMTPTLNREMARFTAGEHSPQSIRDLLRSLEIICLILAVVIAVIVWLASDWLASNWLKADKLPLEVVAKALSIMAFVVALRFIEGIYRGSLFGLQKQVWYNGANVILVTVRQFGAVGMLVWVSSTIQAFFLWQVFFSLLSVVVFALSVHRTLPKSPLPPRFSREAIAGVWHFAGGMLGITLLAILLTQVDKLLLSRLVSLESFGYYTLAATVASILYMVTGPITQAIYPRMVELSSQGDKAQLVSIYHQSAQLITVLTSTAMILLFSYADGIVYMWSGNVDLAKNTSSILSALALGTFLNVLMHVPYHLQLAYGWTSLAIKSNAVAVILLVPAILWIVPHYGAVGAAWIWVILNACYVFVAIQFMHKKIIPDEKWKWYFVDLLMPICGAMGVSMLTKPFKPADYESRWAWVAYLLICGVAMLAASVALASHIRAKVIALIKHSLHWQFSLRNIIK